MSDTHVDAFTHVYKTNTWGNNGHSAYSGSSGGGSTLEFNKPYIAFLKDFITKHGCTSVVDIGCGDFRCGPSIYDDLSVSYTGYDAYNDLIKYHTDTFGTSSKYNFHHLDSFAQKEALAPADLCILKDVIQHWPNAHIHQFLDYLVTSGKYKHILLCNGSWQTRASNDIKIGEFRPLLYTLEPLNRYPLSHIFSYNNGAQHVYLLSVTETPKAIIKILCTSSQRKATMERQIQDVKLSFPVSYFEASVPSNSQEWLLKNIVDWYQRVLCCLNSHLRVMCEAASPDAPPYTIVLEDDASIHQKDFEPVVRNLLNEWEFGVIKEPLISIGWVPMQSYKDLDTQFQLNPVIRDSPGYRYVDQKFFGLQSYIIRRDSLKDLLPFLQPTTFAEFYKMVHAKYTLKDVDIAYADNVFPILMGTRRIFPPVVIEQSLPSIIDSHKEVSTHDTIRNNFFKGSNSKRKEYWNLPRPESPDEVCFAILAKNKAGTLPFYLECVLNQTYPKSKIHLYIRTNDNTDDTTGILQTFVKQHGSKYASVFFDYTNISSALTTFENHEWNATRFKILGRIRQESVDYTRMKRLHYFVADCDNFITSITLENMIAQKSLGVIAPMLTNTTFYSNYHYDIDTNGYLKDHPMYVKVLNRTVQGVIEVPVVHCTYFVSHDVLKDVCYDDGSAKYEYVIFSDGLRKKLRPQYIDNRFIYGFLSQTYIKDEFEAELNTHYRPYLSTHFYNPLYLNPPTPTPVYKVWLCGGLGNRMFQIASVKGLAHKHNCKFEIAGYNQCTSHKNNIYKWIMKQDETPIECDYGTCRSLALYKGFRSFEQLYVHHVGFHPVQVSQENTLFYGFYQSEQYFESIRAELVELFIPSPSVSSDLKAFETSLGKSLQNMVAIHIRLGDFLHNGVKDIHYIDLESYYKRCIMDLPTDLEFMIVCEESDKVTSVYPTLLPFLESRGNISWSESHSEEFDLFLLASCGTVICGNSTFAWWGSWLNQIPDKRVYHPDRWSNKRTSQIDMKGAIVIPAI